MHKLSLLAAAAAAALLAGCGIGAPAYPEFGDVAYRIEGATAAPNGAATTQTVIYRDGPKLRVEAELPTYGQATIVFDESTNAAYVLNPTTPTAAPVPVPQTNVTPAHNGSTIGTPAAPTPAPVAAAPQPTGIAVRIEDSSAPQPLETAWEALGAENARSTGNCEVAGEDGREWTPREAPAPGVDRTACITDDGIVLRVRENDRVLWEATSLQRGAQDATLFGVPTGYQLIDPQAVADQVGEGMDQLDSVTGATPTPAPQQAPAPRG